MPAETIEDTSPRIPRRVFIAALGSAAIAGAAVYLASVGHITAPTTNSFRFARGISLTSGEEDRLRAHLIEALRDDRVAVVIVGHSGTSGDATANQDLSDARAKLVADIAAEIGIDPARVTAMGVGGSAPLARPEDMSERAWQAELSRVDVTLQVRR